MGSQYPYRETYGRPDDIEAFRLELNRQHQLLAECRALVRANGEFLKTAAWEPAKEPDAPQKVIAQAGELPMPFLCKARRNKPAKDVSFADKVADPYIRRFLEQLESQIR